MRGSMAGGEPRPLQGWHVLLYVLGFFAPIFAVNGYFLYSALSTHTGIVANEPYRKGLHYNDRIAADATQAELGWHGDVELAPDNGRLKVAISSRDDTPVPSLRVVVDLGRPSTSRYDATVALDETSPGIYEAAVGQREAGNWIANVVASKVEKDGATTTWRMRRRLWLKPST